jgi:hypothetical protein
MMSALFRLSSARSAAVVALLALSGALSVATGPAHAQGLSPVITGAMGAAAGAMIGDSVGGRNGAILGAAMGGGVGASMGEHPREPQRTVVVTERHDRYYGEHAREFDRRHYAREDYRWRGHEGFQERGRGYAYGRESGWEGDRRGERREH